MCCTIAHEEYSNLHTASGVPQIDFDQLQAVAHHLNCMHYGDDYRLHDPDYDEAVIHQAMANNMLPAKLTRCVLLKREDWDIWLKAEYKLLDSYKAQNMFGTPIPRPAPVRNDKGTLVHPTVLPFVCTYLLKDSVKPKARGTCNGGQQYGRAVTLAHTYVSCVEQPAARLFWALSAIEGMTVIGADVGPCWICARRKNKNKK